MWHHTISRMYTKIVNIRVAEIDRSLGENREGISNPFLVFSVICECVGMQTAHQQRLYLMEPTRSKRDIVTRFFILTASATVS
jgi:hypothetical protein